MPILYYKGYTYVPLSAMKASLGFLMSFDKNNNKVKIDSLREYLGSLNYSIETEMDENS